MINSKSSLEIINIDCPCGYGKNIKEEQKTCDRCGADLTPLTITSSAR